MTEYAIRGILPARLYAKGGATITGDEFRQRIIRAYITIEGTGDSPRPEYGALAWFRRTLRDGERQVHRSTLERWLTGVHRIPVAVVRHLRSLEWDADRVRNGDVRREVVRAKFGLDGKGARGAGRKPGAATPRRRGQQNRR